MLCRPWERQDFNSRLCTFKNYLWSFQAVLNPVECSKKGWKCSGIMQISCELCGSTISLKKSETAKLQVLSSSHADSCPWVAKSCQDTIYYEHNADLAGNVGVVVELLKISLDELSLHWEALNHASFALVNVEKYLEMDSARDIVLAHFGGSQMNDTESLLKLFILALFGWRFHSVLDPLSSSESCVVECASCFRKVGLWQDTRKSALESSASATTSATKNHHASTRRTSLVSSTTSEYVPTASGATSPTILDHHHHLTRSQIWNFDPVSSHRFFCPIVKSIEGLHQAQWMYHYEILGGKKRQ